MDSLWQLKGEWDTIKVNLVDFFGVFYSHGVVNDLMIKLLHSICA